METTSVWQPWRTIDDVRADMEDGGKVSRLDRDTLLVSYPDGSKNLLYRKHGEWVYGDDNSAYAGQYAHACGYHN